VRASVPTARAAVVRLAMPLTGVAVPRLVVPLKKVTVPVGAVDVEEPETGATVAVSVTFAPCTAWAVDDDSVVVVTIGATVAAVTTTERAADVCEAAKMLSPL